MANVSYLNMGDDKGLGKSADSLRQKSEVPTQMVVIAARTAQGKSLPFCEQLNILSTLNKLLPEKSGRVKWPTEAGIEDQLNY
jgi:hypothetical protein